MFREIKQCRICGNSNLVVILDLGEQYLTGVFPAKISPDLSKGPMQLVKCMGRGFCGLVQLRHSYAATEMYGDTYGYRSGLNRSMAEHLRSINDYVRELSTPNREDLVLDIGSNDGTLLACYPTDGPKLVGIDPSARKFQKYYRPDIDLIVDFFSASLFRNHFGERKAKIITSVAMFYDLEQPQSFVDDVAAILADDGVWYLEQSYLPSMLRTNSYDTACHEHIEYYALRQLEWMFERAGLRIIDVVLNKTNGGSFGVTVVKAKNCLNANRVAIEALNRCELEIGLDSLKPFEEFWLRVLRSREELLSFFSQVQRENKRIAGYGASTKGNVLLQFCGITPEMLPYIAEVNEDKFGCFTPGSWIPIVPETQAREMKPDYFLVLPWHFHDGVIKRESDFRQNGGTVVFPLPTLELIS
jgi:SAM-dependent methyltransferase